MLIYLLGVFISAVVWALLTRSRIKHPSVGIKMPQGMGYLLEPITQETLDRDGYNSLLIGLLAVSFLWPFSWSFMILLYACAWFFHGVYLATLKVFGNGAFAKWLFGKKGKHNV